MTTLKQLHKLKNTSITGNTQRGTCLLHGSKIVMWTDSSVTVSLCGYNTLTTRRRIKQVLQILGVEACVYKHNHIPYLQVLHYPPVEMDPYAQYTILDGDVYSDPHKETSR